jgi:hypothetical protein
MTSHLIDPDFVARWEPRYDAQKYPLGFLLGYGASARSAERPEALRDALIALLHWKDGKARSFVPGESHAKPNTLKPLLALHEAALIEFATLFRLAVEADDKKFVQSTQGLLDALRGMWSSIVMPAFVLHIARPDRLPIIDQHTVRAFFQLKRDEVVEEPRITWRLWQDYIVFFHDAAAAVGHDSGLERRYQVDRALFAYGQSLKRRFKGGRPSQLHEASLSSAGSV